MTYPAQKHQRTLVKRIIQYVTIVNTTFSNYHIAFYIGLACSDFKTNLYITCVC